MLTQEAYYLGDSSSESVAVVSNPWYFSEGKFTGQGPIYEDSDMVDSDEDYCYLAY